MLAERNRNTLGGKEYQREENKNKNKNKIETASNPASNGCEEAAPAINVGAPSLEVAEAAAETVAEPVTESCPAPAPAPVAPMAGIRGRVPPGGHSSGPFW